MVGIVNHEVNNVDDCFNRTLVTAKSEGFECVLDKTSCEFIKQFGNDDIAEMVGSGVYDLLISTKFDVLETL